MYKKVVWFIICYFSICISVFANTAMPQIQSEGAILIEPKTNTVLYGKNEHKKLYPASTTKILTAMIVLEELNQNSTLTKSQGSVNTVPADSSHIGLAVGDSISVKDALYGLLVGSDNFIAHDLAIASKGSIDNFASRMNEKAKHYGALNTHFTNPHGYHDPNHYTTAYDLAQIARETFSVPELIKMAATTKYTVKVLNTNRTITVTNKNRLLDSNTPYYNEHVVAAKTGFHDDAQQTLVAKAIYGDMELIAVVMKVKSPGQYEDINKLFEYGQEYFKVSQDGERGYELINQTASPWAQSYIDSALKNKWITEKGANYKEAIPVQHLIYMLNVAIGGKERITLEEIGGVLGESLKKEETLTRLQIARLMPYLTDKYACFFEIKEGMPFIPDIESLSAKDQENIKFTVRRGILGASNTIYRPNDKLTWQEAACMASRLLEGK